MFDGVADQFHHQFMASPATSRRSSRNLHVPLSLSRDLHNLASSSGFDSFDPLFNSNSYGDDDDHHHQVPLQLLQQQEPQLHPLHYQHYRHCQHHHQQQQPAVGQKSNEEKEDNTSLVAMNMEVERERSMAEPIDPWSNDEVLALLRIRSSLENWSPELTWEHVSRKLAELGFKRSAENCKEKFEEESRYFNNSINYSSKNCKIFSELEELCQDHDHHHNSQQVVVVVVADEKNKNVEKSREDGSRNIGHHENQTSERNNGSEQDNEKLVNNGSSSNNKKIRKKQKKFEMIKEFCEEIVNKLMNQQEEMQNKLIEDMLKRYEEKVARDEAWKKQALDRINQELQVRAKEQAVAGDRQAAIINFLSKFSLTGSSKKQRFGRFNNGDLVKVPPNEHSNPPITSSSLVPVAQNPNPVFNIQNNFDQVSAITMILDHQNSSYFPSPTQNSLQNPIPKKPILSPALGMAPPSPNSVNDESNPLPPPSSPLTVNKATQNLITSSDKEDHRKRWPRDEVLALINLRCSLYNKGGDHEGEAAMKAPPLWERISQGMLDLGYKRSSKRCKEKWENINKYFRKTKHVNKNRSLHSRTCPYFHQLSTFYNQGTLIAPSQVPENHSTSPENHWELLESGTDPSQRGASL